MASGSGRQECVYSLRRAFTPEMYEEEGSPRQFPDAQSQILAKITSPIPKPSPLRAVAYYKEFHNSMNVFICKPHGIT